MITLESDPQRVAFEQSQRDSELSSRCLLAVFAYLGIPGSFLDIGCGPGHLVKLASKLNVAAHGVDLYAPPDDPRFTRRDLTDVYQIFAGEIVVCWEVAEHIERKHADHLCKLLAESTLRCLLFSAAVPGQGGSGHLNEQPHDYWRDKLVARGLSYDYKLTPRLRRVFRHVAPRAWWYSANLLVFRKGD